MADIVAIQWRTGANASRKSIRMQVCFARSLAAYLPRRLDPLHLFCVCSERFLVVAWKRYTDLELLKLFGAVLHAHGQDHHERGLSDRGRRARPSLASRKARTGLSVCEGVPGRGVRL